MNRCLTWKRFHKWTGMIFSVIMLVFCISGIILNHREAFSDFDISRKFLPQSYHLDQYNNGIVKGTLKLNGDSLLAYGNCGIWLTDRDFRSFVDFNHGLPAGIDQRNIKNILRHTDGSLWCAAQFGIYKFIDGSWRKASLPYEGERISDITFNSDTTSVIVLTRSQIFSLDPINKTAFVHNLQSPGDGKQTYTLFKTFWMLHSGELFGVPGRIVVDIIAVIISFLCLTGIILFCIPYRIKWRKRHCKPVSRKTLQFFKLNFKWHDKVGYTTAILTILIAFTGMCLRPPLMIPLVLTKTSPLPYTAQDTDNYWRDKLRSIRWEKNTGRWLISTSEGFIVADEDFTGTPIRITKGVQPPVSPMGITVFEQLEKDEWLIGSFSGIYKWNPTKGKVTDFITGKEYNPDGHNYAAGAALVSGISRDLNIEPIAIFDYAKGIGSLPRMSPELTEQPMSLWNVALELHVGRCYTPFLGPFSELFVFTAGLLLTLILVSGIIIRTRKSNHNNLKSNEKS